MNSIANAFFVIALGLTSYAEEIRPLVPEAGQTPGHLCETTNKDFKEYRYVEKIPYCARNVSTSRKAKIYTRYEVPAEIRNQYTIDHFIPLSIGGSNDDRNLWPEHKKLKALRPNLEMQLYIAIREGRITQKEAIESVVDAKLHPQQTH